MEISMMMTLLVNLKESWMQAVERYESMASGLARQYNQEQAVGQGARPPKEYIQIYSTYFFSHSFYIV